MSSFCNHASSPSSEVTWETYKLGRRLSIAYGGKDHIKFGFIPLICNKVVSIVFAIYKNTPTNQTSVDRLLIIITKINIEV